MEKFSEDLVLKVTVDLSGNACYISKSGTETVELSIITKGNSKDVSLLGKISYSSQDSDVFLTSVKNAVISLVDDDAKNFVRRIIFSHFNNFSSIKRNEGLYDAEILAYSKYILGVEKLPVVSLTYKDVSPIATCDLDSKGLIDKKGDVNVYDARTEKIKNLVDKEIKSQPKNQQKLSKIFSKAYSSLYGGNFTSSQDKSIVCPIIVLGDSHASVMLIEAIKQEDGTIKYKWESCDSSGYHFNKYFKGYNDVKSFYKGVDFQGNIGNCPIFALAAFKEFKNQKFKSLEEAL